MEILVIMEEKIKKNLYKKERKKEMFINDWYKEPNRAKQRRAKGKLIWFDLMEKKKRELWIWVIDNDDDDDDGYVFILFISCIFSLGGGMGVGVGGLLYDLNSNWFTSKKHHIPPFFCWFWF